jgi:tetratricopeptide (TPR) repeat protein
MPANQLQDTNSQALLQTLQQLQAQFNATQASIEQNAKDAKVAAAESGQILSRGLEEIENAISSQQAAFAARSARELEAMRNSNRVMLVLAGTFAGIAFLALLVTAYFQWRMSKAWARISTVLPVSRALGGGSALAALGTGKQDSVEDSNRRLLGAMEQLKKQVEVLEDASRAALKLQAPSKSGDNGTSSAGPKGRVAPMDSGEAATNGDQRIPVLLREGQIRLRENNLKAALECFDQILAINPNHSEALVRKGATLERLKKLTEAFECYDRAIAADDSMTLAYLYKGGLCNRLERFKEALECYDKALQTQVE